MFFLGWKITLEICLHQQEIFYSPTTEILEPHGEILQVVSFSWTPVPPVANSKLHNFVGFHSL